MTTETLNINSSDGAAPEPAAPINNHIVLRGNLGQQPRLQTTAKGGALLSFSVAQENRWAVDLNGRRVMQSETYWVNVTLFRNAEMYSRELNKGDNVTIIGQLSQRVGSDGMVYYNVVAEDVQVNSQRQTNNTVTLRGTVGNLPVYDNLLTASMVIQEFNSEKNWVLSFRGQIVHDLQGLDLREGEEIEITGKLQVRENEQSDLKVRKYFVVDVRTLDFIESEPASAGAGGEAATISEAAGEAAVVAPASQFTHHETVDAVSGIQEDPWNYERQQDALHGAENGELDSLEEALVSDPILSDLEQLAAERVAQYPTMLRRMSSLVEATGGILRELYQDELERGTGVKERGSDRERLAWQLAQTRYLSRLAGLKLISPEELALFLQLLGIV